MQVNDHYVYLFDKDGVGIDLDNPHGVIMLVESLAMGVSMKSMRVIHRRLAETTFLDLYEKFEFNAAISIHDPDKYWSENASVTLAANGWAVIHVKLTDGTIRHYLDKTGHFEKNRNRWFGGIEQWKSQRASSM